MIINTNNINSAPVSALQKKQLGNAVFEKLCGRSDSLDLSAVFEQYAKADDKTNAEITQMLAEANKSEDNSNGVAEIHSEMQKILYSQINGEKEDIRLFNSYCDERAYYEKLLESDGEIIISEGKYDFGHFEAGETVSREAVENALADVQKSIDRLVTDEPYEASENRPAVFEDITRKVYNEYAKALASATGIRSAYLNEAGENSPLFDRSGRTEENFVQKANERIECIKSHSRGLRDTVEQYSKVQKLENSANSENSVMLKLLLETLDNEIISEGEFAAEKKKLLKHLY